MNVDITAIPALDSNYIWLIANRDLGEAYIVDPGAAEPALDCLRAQNLDLKGVLITHSHADHIAGIDALVSAANSYAVPVIGPQTMRIPSLTQIVREGAQVELWPELNASVIEVPGHLPEHIAFYIPETGNFAPALFSGDCLFSSGCGRMFQGTPEQFHQSLARLSALPDPTRVFCGHEYTLANLAFAEHIEPDNAEIQNKITTCTQRLDTTACSLPSTIGDEKRTNPFLRCHKNHVHSRVCELTGSVANTEVDVFAKLRKLKDRF